MSYLSCIAIVVIDGEEEHDAEDRGGQHGQQVRLKAPNILDRPNIGNTKFPQKQIHHLEQGFTQFNKIKGDKPLDWIPMAAIVPLLPSLFTCCNINYLHS